MKTLNFKTAFKYPFNRGKGMLNILWLLVPILGWFALIGYSIKIMQEFISGKFKQLPEFNFSDNLSLGFIMFIKSLALFIPYGIVMTIIEQFSAVGDILGFLIELFAIPILLVNFVHKETISSLYEFQIISTVFDNIKEYLIAVIKSIGLFLVYLVMIIILVGIPAMAFTNNIFIADFYRLHILKNK